MCGCARSIEVSYSHSQTEGAIGQEVLRQNSCTYLQQLQLATASRLPAELAVCLKATCLLQGAEDFQKSPASHPRLSMGWDFLLPPAIPLLFSTHLLHAPLSFISPYHPTVHPAADCCPVPQGEGQRRLQGRPLGAGTAAVQHSSGAGQQHCSAGPGAKPHNTRGGSGGRGQHSTHHGTGEG